MDIYTKLTANMDELAETFKTRMLQVEGDIKKLSSPASQSKPPHKDIDSLYQEFSDFRALIWKTMATIRSQFELLSLGLDRQETASRRKVLLLHGITEVNEASALDTVMSMLSDQFKLPGVLPEQISSCHRLGNNTSKPRPIMVRFVDFKLRTLVWNAKTALKGTNITVSEFLTKTRHDVFMAARKHFGIRRCWTSEGKIVLLLPDNKRRKLESMLELKPLLAEYPAVIPSQPSREKASTAPGPAEKPKPSSATVPTKAGKIETRSKRPR